MYCKGKKQLRLVRQHLRMRADSGWRCTASQFRSFALPWADRGLPFQGEESRESVKS